MEIVACEKSCYNLLLFVAFKMELHWRPTPIGKVNANFPLYNEILEKEFTQKS